MPVSHMDLLAPRGLGAIVALRGLREPTPYLSEKSTGCTLWRSREKIPSLRAILDYDFALSGRPPHPLFRTDPLALARSNLLNW